MSYSLSPQNTKRTNEKQTHPRTVPALLFLFAISTAILCVPAGAALVTDVQGSSLPATQIEGAEVAYTVVITGIPSQTASLELSTDLMPVTDAPLWTTTTKGVTIDSPNERLIHLSADESFPVSVTLEMTGRVPTISTTKTVDGVVIKKIASQRGGYLYYNVKALDAQGKSLGVASTGTLTIEVADEQSFLGRTDAVDDKNFRNLLTAFYAKGLTTEAWEVLEWYEAKPTPMPVFVPVIVGVAALVIGLAAGVVVGMKSAYRKLNNDDEVF